MPKLSSGEGSHAKEQLDTMHSPSIQPKPTTVHKPTELPTKELHPQEALNHPSTQAKLPLETKNHVDELWYKTKLRFAFEKGKLFARIAWTGAKNFYNNVQVVRQIYARYRYFEGSSASSLNIFFFFSFLLALTSYEGTEQLRGKNSD
jgi:hypothetical protein